MSIYLSPKYQCEFFAQSIAIRERGISNS